MVLGPAPGAVQDASAARRYARGPDCVGRQHLAWLGWQTATTEHVLADDLAYSGLPQPIPARGMKKVVRFFIRSAEGDEPIKPGDVTPGAVLSKALGRAARVGGDPGVWEVWEYEDLLYRVHRLEGDKLDVRVEVIRA